MTAREIIIALLDQYVESESRMDTIPKQAKDYLYGEVGKAEEKLLEAGYKMRDADFIPNRDNLIAAAKALPVPKAVGPVIESLNITVVMRTSDFMAYFTGDKTKWEAGDSSAEAIGKLITRHSSLVISFAPAQKK